MIPLLLLWLLPASDAATRAERLWQHHDYEQANEQFRQAVKEDPKNAHYRVRWGRLLLERFNKKDALDLFGEALEIDENSAEAMLGMALAASDGFESKAVELAERAIKLDPKLVETRELLARLALEDSDTKRATEEANQALAISGKSIAARAILATIDWLNDREPSPPPGDAETYATAGYFFVLNRRYDEGVRYYQKAVELDPGLDSARSQLGINLMRLGREDEARRELEQCYNRGYRNSATVNTLRLLDSYKNFTTFKTPTTILKVDKKEADLLRPYFEAELQKAIATYEKKYRMHLDGPVQVEVYPNHEDFAVRTLGMPGLGALGVTFGQVVAMDSPSGRPPGTFHWGTTMWHELSHVYVLTATKHRVPRWFTEGLAVYEETAVSPEWGDRLTPEVVLALKEKKLLPVAQLDQGFVRPSYPAQVVVSYFQAGRICNFIAAKWSYDKLLAMIHDFAEHKATPDVIRQEFQMAPEEFDKQFLAWIDAETAKTVQGFDEWKKRMRGLSEMIKAKQFDGVIREAKAARDLYPEYVEEGNAYEVLAEAYLKENDKASASADLERYARIGGRSPAALKKLAALLEESGQKKEAAAALARINYIYPEDEEVHRKLGELWLEQGNAAGAVREYRAALALKPLDQAASHYNLARALRSDHQMDAARDELLSSLEAAPGYRPAQKMLLEITAEKK